ncbi:MAG: hypothetical protein R2681_14495 [Pyrinomonadaceae bacterium]
MKKLVPILLVAFSIFAAGCGGLGAGSNISVKVDGKEHTFEPKSTWAYHSTKSFSYPEDGKTVLTKSSVTHIVLANFDLDTSQAFISLGKQKLEKPEQIKITLSITGEKETSVDTPIKAGAYKAEEEKFNKVDSVTIYYFADGEEKRMILDDKKLKGTINIASVSDGTINGDVDVTDGENTVKGGFSAKGDKSVK